jgi:NAD(P)-dependent dehydrogenase (short-subunit alcohol dehydrogenase family)
MPLARKVLVVTGGGRGIGAGIALLAARLGYAVCVNFQSNASSAENVVSQIISQGGNALAIKADVSDPEEASRLFDLVDEKLGPLVALVNNAGIPGKRGKLTQLDVTTIKRVFEVNLLGTILCSREAIKRMALSSGGIGGGIVNISSQAAFFGGREIIPYAASKAAINNFTLALSKEVAEEGIRVNAISPGIIDTEQQDFSGSRSRDNVIAQIPLNRLGASEDIAEAVLWLLSEKASYITGVVLPVAGGR